MQTLVGDFLLNVDEGFALENFIGMTVDGAAAGRGFNCKHIL